MPQNTLYLDDARIGRFRPQARKLYQSFLDFVADSPSSRNVFNFLIDGTENASPVNVNSQRSLKAWIASFLNSAIDTKSGEDSLMHMLHAIDHGRDTRFPETVNLGGLFAGYGAWTATPSPQSALPVRISNADCVASIAQYIGWNALRPDESLRTGSLVLQSTDRELRKRDSDSLRESFAEAGIVLSTYGNGVIRMAMPAQLLTTEQFLSIQSAFIHVDTPMRVAS